MKTTNARRTSTTQRGVRYPDFLHSGIQWGYAFRTANRIRCAKEVEKLEGSGDTNARKDGFAAGGMLESSGGSCDSFPSVACRGCKLNIKTRLIQAVVGTLDNPQPSSAKNPSTLENMHSCNRNRDSPWMMLPRIATHDLPASSSGAQTPTDGVAGTPSSWNEMHSKTRQTCQNLAQTP